MTYSSYSTSSASSTEGRSGGAASVGARWSKEEDARLLAAVETVGPKNWRRISEEFLGGARTDVQCLHRWTKVLRPASLNP